MIKLSYHKSLEECESILISLGFRTCSYVDSVFRVGLCNCQIIVSKNDIPYRYTPDFLFKLMGNE